MWQIDNNCMAFDIAIGLYEWLAHNYAGWRCEKYGAMCHITDIYSLQSRGLDEMAEFYYDELTEDNWKEAFDDFCKYMDNEWDLEAC
jgi:hypothetical protein